MKLIWYPKCTTCQKAAKWLDDRGCTYRKQDIKETPPTVAELTAWYRVSGLPLKKLFNTSGRVYQSMGLKDLLPSLSEEEQLRLLATNGMLVKRPILVTDKGVTFGFREEVWQELTGE